MAHEPDVGCRVEYGKVLDQVLRYIGKGYIQLPMVTLWHRWPESKNTYDANRVKQTILHERRSETCVVAPPVIGVAVADRVEYPGEVYAGATTGEEEVVVVLVLLRCGALDSGSLDGQDDGRVV